MIPVFRLLLFCIVLFPSLAEARSLYWQEMEVTARLDETGRLQIREQQTMVFSGAWNGGERRFSIRPGQRMKFEGISRLDADGREIPLVRGNLNLVDHWDHNGQTSIRWRSRLPSAPAFNDTQITYVLYYSLSHILIADQEGFLLNHDFCFPDRSGVVKTFRLDVEFDPVWNNDPISLVRRDVAPGQGVVLSRQLHVSGQTRPTVFKAPVPLPEAIPAPPASPAPGWLGFALLTLLTGGVAWRIRTFFQWERSLDRFARVLPAESIDQRWLEQELFVHKPEVVGATWDKTTSTPEVAAILARLVQEGKMESWMEPYLFPYFNFPVPGIPPILHLKLLQPQESFLGYEYKLIKGLFVDGNMTTDTKTIRDYYRKKRKTFDPVRKITEPLKRQVKKLTDDGSSSLHGRWIPTVVLAIVGFFLLLSNAFLHQEEWVPLEMAAVSGAIFCWFAGIISAFVYRDSVISLGVKLVWLFFFVTAVVIGFGVLLFFSASTLLLLGVFSLAAAINNNIMNIAHARESAEGLALRRNLAAARNYFQQELAREKPQIEDSWFPYLLAFGLGPTVDSWFRKYGGHMSSIRSAGSSLDSGSGTGFSGGGGSFGGGGASGSWSMAVGSLTASGGGSSSGGGGGGSSSGGGGGGGW